MRVVVTGASGNHGTALLRRLATEPAVTEVVGISRRRPPAAPDGPPATSWHTLDVAEDDLRPVFAGADAVVHLAWLIQPSRDLAELARVNLFGSERVFRAAAEAGVGTLVHASSIGAYGAGPKTPVAEDHPTNGIPSSFYSRHKAACERALDRLERAHPELRVVRVRPGIVLQRDAATEIRRLFIGPFLPNALVRKELVALVPDIPDLRTQIVHADDVAEAYRLILLDPGARGAYNLAAEPPVDARLAARVLGARTVPFPATVARAAATLSWKLRLQPTPPGWLDMARALPLMDTSRARDELGWRSSRSADEILTEFVAALRQGAGTASPPLDPGTSGPLRSREVLTGIGARNP